jgi:hypothetical protein
MVIKRKPTPPLKRKPVEIPADLAKAFIEEMQAFHAEDNAIKRDEIDAEFPTCQKASERPRRLEPIRRNLIAP